MNTVAKEMMKDLIQQIVRAKYQADKDSTLFINPDLFNKLQKHGVVVHWKENHKKECLVLHGVRQCGKTFIIRCFGKQY